MKTQLPPLRLIENSTLRVGPRTHAFLQKQAQAGVNQVEVLATHAKTGQPLKAAVNPTGK